jgi:hypothetical protein
MRANLAARSTAAVMPQSPDPAAGVAAPSGDEPGGNSHQDRVLTPEQAESLPSLLEPMTGDRIGGTAEPEVPLGPA